MAKLDESDDVPDTHRKPAPAQKSKPPRCLPAEVIQRIVGFLARSKEYDDEAASYDKPRRDLVSVSLTSRALYLMVMPLVCEDVGKEFWEIAKFFNLVDSVNPAEGELLLEEIDWTKKNGHPIDWKYPTRILWFLSLVRYITFMPRKETIGAMSPKRYQMAAFADAAWRTSRSQLPLLSSLKSLCLDMTRWHHHPERSLRPSYYENIYQELVRSDKGFVLDMFLKYIDQGVQPKLICLDRWDIQLDGTMSRFESLPSKVAIPHNFGYHNCPAGLPECHTIIFSFSQNYLTHNKRYALLRCFIVPEDVQRILFVRLKVEHDGCPGLACYQEADGDGEKWFDMKMDEMVKAAKELRRWTKLEWGYIEELLY